jgi:hypothetical protein
MSGYERPMASTQMRYVCIITERGRFNAGFRRYVCMNYVAVSRIWTLYPPNNEEDRGIARICRTKKDSG